MMPYFRIFKKHIVLTCTFWISIFFCGNVIVSCKHPQTSSSNKQSQRIAFVKRESGVNHIFLMDIDSTGNGTNIKRLTNDPDPENYPSCSPNGKKISYQRDYNGAAMYTINIDGTEQQRLSPTPGFDVNPSWSPDGTKIIYTRVLGNMVPNQIPKTEIHIMNSDGSQDKVVLAQNNFSVEPRWSVNDKIVFMNKLNSRLNIFTMNIDGTNLQQLTAQGNNGDPVWSPDGSKISFGSDREGNGKLNIFVMDADGSNVKQLTHFNTPYESGDTNWSPDGKKIVFEYDVDGKLQSDPDAYAEVWTMNADGSGQVSTNQPCSCVGCAPRWLH